jgi:hypothetical protein
LESPGGTDIILLAGLSLLQANASKNKREKEDPESILHVAAELQTVGDRGGFSSDGDSTVPEVFSAEGWLILNFGLKGSS